MKGNTIKAFIKFCVVGAINTAISLGIYYILIALGVNYAISITVGYILSSICGYLLSKTWVFKKKEEKATKSVFKYYALYASALILNLLCMTIFIKGMHVSDKVAPILTVIITTIYNFTFSKLWVFRESKNAIDPKLLKQDKVFIALAVIAAMFIGMIVVNNYFNHPVADDYTNYNDIAAEIGDQEINIGTTVPAIGRLAVRTYQTWQGTYFANFLFFINPLLISVDAYKIAMLLIQIFWLAGSYFLFKSLPEQNQKDKVRNLKLFLLFIIANIFTFYSLGEGLYWFTGSILYIIPYTISLILFGLIMRDLRNPCNKRKALIVLTSIILGGTSYVTGLVVGFTLLLLTIYLFIKKDKQRYFYLATLAIFCIGFACNVFCPGNFQRTKDFEKISIIKAIVYAAINAVIMIRHALFETILVPVLIIATPMLANIAYKLKQKIKYPILLAILCLGCFVATFVPMAYAYGTTYQETRVKNIQIFYLVLMCAVCMIAFFAKVKTKNQHIYENPTLVPIGTLAAIIMIAAIGVYDIPGLNMVNDYLELKNVTYDRCIDEMDNKLINSPEDQVEITNCAAYPSSLHYYVIENESWQTDAMEVYFHKDIVVKEEE